jgi:hypothetical protein
MAAVRMRLPSFVLVVVVVTASRSISAIFWDLDLSLGLCFAGRGVSLRQSPAEPSPHVLGMAISEKHGLDTSERKHKRPRTEVEIGVGSWIPMVSIMDLP